MKFKKLTKKNLKDIGRKYGVGTTVEYEDYLFLWKYIEKLQDKVDNHINPECHSTYNSYE